MVELVKFGELYKSLGLSEKEIRSVRSDVYRIIRLLAKSQNTKVPRNKLPVIDIQGGGSSAYDRRNNLILIARESIGKGESYAAEVGHYFRDLMTDKIYERESKDLDELRVGEFFDRAAYIMAREKSKGTRLSRLFSGKSIDYSSPEGRRALAEMGKSARRQYREIKGEPNSVLDKIFRLGRAEDEVIHFRSHIPYSYADQYSADELLKVDGLFSLSKEDVKKRFFKKRKSSLERSVEAALYILTPIFLFYLLFSVRYTGFFIFLSNNYAGATGIFLYFVILLLLLFFKIKRLRFS